jgi:hypothetical protein
MSSPDSQQTLVIGEISSNEGLTFSSSNSDLELIHYLTACRETQGDISILEVPNSLEFVPKK